MVAGKSSKQVSGNHKTSWLSEWNWNGNLHLNLREKENPKARSNAKDLERDFNSDSRNWKVTLQCDVDTERHIIIPIAYKQSFKVSSKF